LVTQIPPGCPREPEDVTRETYDRVAVQYCETTRVNDTRQAVVSTLADFVEELAPNSRVLVLGAGDGRDAALLLAAGHRVVCVDYSTSMLALCRAAAPTAEMWQEDMRSLALEPASFDAVWASACLYHVQKRHLPGILSQILHGLKPHGRAYLNLRLGSGEVLEPHPRSFPEGGPRFYAYYDVEEALALVHRFFVARIRTADPALRDYVELWLIKLEQPSNSMELFADVQLSCRVGELGPSQWVATVHRLLGDAPERAVLAGFGGSSKEAREDLASRIRAKFTMALGEASLVQFLAAALRWTWSAGSVGVRIVRLSAVLVVTLVLSVFFVDIEKLRQNFQSVSDIARPRQEVSVVPDGFLNEAFFKERLSECQRRFWAAGTSFRTLVTGNRDALMDVVTKGECDVEIVLLDPSSPLATEDFMSKFSRTARPKDLEESIQRFSGPNGVLKSTPARHKHRLWTAEYAPIVPMVVVDDLVYVSFLTRVDRQGEQSSYQGPYFIVNANSNVGRRLIRHFDELRASAHEIQY
jgi:SAM-dependent methyltransferase